MANWLSFLIIFPILFVTTAGNAQVKSYQCDLKIGRDSFGKPILEDIDLKQKLQSKGWRVVEVSSAFRDIDWQTMNETKWGGIPLAISRPNDFGSILVSIGKTYGGPGPDTCWMDYAIVNSSEVVDSVTSKAYCDRNRNELDFHKAAQKFVEKVKPCEVPVAASKNNQLQNMAEIQNETTVR